MLVTDGTPVICRQDACCCFHCCHLLDLLGLSGDLLPGGRGMLLKLNPPAPTLGVVESGASNSDVVTVLVILARLVSPVP